MSHNDKRTPHTDALETLGMIHQHDEKRDAIHLGVEPVIAASASLYPGQRIGIIDGHAYATGIEWDGKIVPYHGIVDPFLPKGPLPGEAFWFVMAPRMITSLRHVWEHPDFPDSRETSHEVTAPKAWDDLSDAERKTHVAIGTELGKAWEFLEEYARELSDYDDQFTADDLFDTGKVNLEDPSGWNYLVGGSSMEGERPSAEYWEAMSVLLNRDLTEVNKPNFFSCSC